MGARGRDSASALRHADNHAWGGSQILNSTATGPAEDRLAQPVVLDGGVHGRSKAMPVHLVNHSGRGVAKEVCQVFIRRTLVGQK